MSACRPDVDADISIRGDFHLNRSTAGGVKRKGLERRIVAYGDFRLARQPRVVERQHDAALDRLVQRIEERGDRLRTVFVDLVLREVHERLERAVVSVYVESLCLTSLKSSAPSTLRAAKRLHARPSASGAEGGGEGAVVSGEMGDRLLGALQGEVAVPGEERIDLPRILLGLVGAG